MIVIFIVIFIVICDFGQCFDYYWLTVPVDICNSALSGLLQKDRPVPAPWPRELSGRVVLKCSRPWSQLKCSRQNCDGLVVFTGCCFYSVLLLTAWISKVKYSYVLITWSSSSYDKVTGAEGRENTETTKGYTGVRWWYNPRWINIIAATG